MSLNQKDAKHARRLVQSCIDAALADGELDPRGKTEEQFACEVHAYLKPPPDVTLTFSFTDDHRSRLLRQARVHRNKDRHEEAVLYYATWIEHMLNVFVASAFRRKRFPQDIIRQFVRDAGISAKYIFLIEHFCGNAPSTDRLTKLTELSQRRNQFVHFKWLYYEETEWCKQRADYARAVKDAERLVTHFEYLERKYLRHDRPKRITKT